MVTCAQAFGVVALGSLGGMAFPAISRCSSCTVIIRQRLALSRSIKPILHAISDLSSYVDLIKQCLALLRSIKANNVADSEQGTIQVSLCGRAAYRHVDLVNITTFSCTLADLHQLTRFCMSWS